MKKENDLMEKRWSGFCCNFLKLRWSDMNYWSASYISQHESWHLHSIFLGISAYKIPILYTKLFLYLSHVCTILGLLFPCLAPSFLFFYYFPRVSQNTVFHMNSCHKAVNVHICIYKEINTIENFYNKKNQLLPTSLVPRMNIYIKKD